MVFSLGQRATEHGYRLESYESVGSTNALALERAGDGDTGKLWIAASRQEFGRGRRGRVWSTPSGNLAATILICESRPSEHSATLGFVAGLSLADALATVTSDRIRIGVDGAMTAEGARFELKWPNDILSGGAKLAGILLESTMTQRGHAVAVGIGVNVVAFPEDTPYPATSLKVIGSSVSAEMLFSALSDAWCENFAVWNSGHGLPAIRVRWLERAAGLGSDVAVKIGDRVVRGRFETIDESGRFVIRLADGSLEHITAGDVHFGAVASATAV